ncbi:FtsX-like permease family protein [Rhodopirellula halodulae]|uniref:FtsX-like permease family protein n=1 Tax=Rhodopirellula halodulae TaxID=2894198 RepID=UPI001E57BF8F|nr:FtsX-like permease family protein [Rhodopirellula sp. JC737]MCC9657633.1 FtsX-like permease family protein [Rhodopirellula sp. JC737]
MESSARSVSMGSLVVSTLRHRQAVTLAVALGVATATAVITGALLVGDSMRGSLRSLTVERLGRIESIVSPGAFFPIDQVTLDGQTITVSANEDSEANPGAFTSTPVILFPGGSVEAEVDSDNRQRRIGGVQILGIEDAFWDLDVTGIRPEASPGDQSVVLNQAAADELRVAVGDQVTLRLPVEGAVPADSPLGRREIQSEGLPRMKVAAIVADAGLGRFSLSPNQAAPKTVFASREVIAEVLDREGQANAILDSRKLDAESVDWSLEALGWNLQTIERGENADGQPVIHYLSLTSENLLLPTDAVRSIQNVLPRDTVTPIMTYLANAIEFIDPESGEVLVNDQHHSVPYSTLSALDSGPTLALDYSIKDVASMSSESSGDEDRVPIVINDWTADRLGAKPGDSVRVFFYEPEVENGREVERSFDATITQVVPVTIPSKPYRRNREAVFDESITPYNDPNLTPDVPGVTDQASIGDWDLPFQLERDIDREDDQYWNEQRLTPKAFVPLAVGQKQFGSRFGETTGLRLDPKLASDMPGLRADILEATRTVQAELGWTPRLIQAEQLAASKGTTPFDGLFLALSFFVILAAVMLIALLLRLGVLQRLSEFGTLLAIGFTPGRVMRLALSETAVTAAIGTLLGILGGVAYAWGVLWALRSWWVGAVTVPFLQFHATPLSIGLGGVLGWLVCMMTAVWTLRFLLKLNPSSLVGGRITDTTSAMGKRVKPSTNGTGSRVQMIAWALVILAVVAAIAGAMGGGQQAAGGFVAAGMLLLIAMLIGVHQFIRRKRTASTSETNAGEVNLASRTLNGLAAANARRSPLRSTLAIGLVATAAFLILSISVFRLSPTREGTGGFDLIGQTAQPLHQDLRAEDIRSELLGRDADLLAEAAVRVVPFRMKSGDDASCNNLYQAMRPTVIGLSPDDSLDGFGWAGMAGETAEATWQMLDVPASGTADDPVPVVIDQNTAMWSLQMRSGIGEVKAFTYDADPIHFRVVGLLAGSVLQGKLIVGEQAFENVFPRSTGYQYFLFAIGGDQQNADTVSTMNDAQDIETIDQVSEVLESRLVDAGMDVQRADRVLEGLLAVQNTYLRTFQSLGALGLLLGTIGLAVAQLRSVLERRGELAVMRAVGFSRQRLAALVLGENTFLLALGIGCGAVTALLAVLPYAWLSGTQMPILEPLGILIVIFAFGTLAGLVAVRKVLTLPLVESLRAENAVADV